MWSNWFVNPRDNHIPPQVDYGDYLYAECVGRPGTPWEGQPFTSEGHVVSGDWLRWSGPFETPVGPRNALFVVRAKVWRGPSKFFDVPCEELAPEGEEWLVPYE